MQNIGDYLKFNLPFYLYLYHVFLIIILARPDPPVGVKLTQCYGLEAKLEFQFDESLSNFNNMDHFIIEAKTEYEDIWSEVFIIKHL